MEFAGSCEVSRGIFRSRAVPRPRSRSCQLFARRAEIQAHIQIIAGGRYGDESCPD
jgi:hypothetical protein